MVGLDLPKGVTFATNRGILSPVFGLGGTEIIVIVLVALLFLGPDKLPEAATKLSRGIRDLRKQSKALQETIENDERIGGAIRDLRSALHDDPSRPARPVMRPVVRPEVAPAGQSTVLVAPTAPGALPTGDAAVAALAAPLSVEGAAPSSVEQGPTADAVTGPVIVAAPDAVAKGSRGDA